MSRKSYASVPALPSLFARSTWDFKSQTIYITTYCLTCSQDHENLFEGCKILNPDLRNMKALRHLSPIEIKPTINQGMDWCLKTVLSTDREVVNPNESRHSIFELISRKTKRRESDQSRERERDSAWSDVIKLVTLNQPTTYSTVVLKTGYRQTDKSFLYRLTDCTLSV
jgi:hypothetical protein